MDSKKRILGIDYGGKRVGISVSDPTNIIARGLTVIINSGNLIDGIKSLAEEYGVGSIVVGMPFRLDGEKGEKAEEVSSFISRLRQATGLDVVPWDERFTTREAHRTMREMGVRKMKRQSKSAIDMTAAALILQGYLDSLNVRKT